MAYLPFCSSAYGSAHVMTWLPTNLSKMPCCRQILSAGHSCGKENWEGHSRISHNQWQDLNDRNIEPVHIVCSTGRCFCSNPECLGGLVLLHQSLPTRRIHSKPAQGENDSGSSDHGPAEGHKFQGTSNCLRPKSHTIISRLRSAKLFVPKGSWRRRRPL